MKTMWSSTRRRGVEIAAAKDMEAIYTRPRDYDLEHAESDEDIAFYMRLVDRWRPQRVMELASGSGRVAIPLVLGVPDVEVTGLEREGPMLDESWRKHARLERNEATRLTFIPGDMRSWHTPTPFDLIIAPCSSLSHLLTIDDQIAAWQCAYDNLTDEGRFVVDLTMPNFAAFAESMQAMPRSLLEVDVDATDPQTGVRLLRYKTTRYLAHQQRAQIRFLYDRFSERHDGERYASDFDCHVYYPRELELLFRLTGFRVEAWFGDYTLKRLGPGSRQLIAVGRKLSRAHSTRTTRQ